MYWDKLKAGGFGCYHNREARETENITIIRPSDHFMRDFSARKCIK